MDNKKYWDDVSRKLRSAAGFDLPEWDDANERVWKDSMFWALERSEPDASVPELVDKIKSKYDAVESGSFLGNLSSGLSMLKEEAVGDTDGSDIWVSKQFSRLASQNQLLDVLDPGMTLGDAISKIGAVGAEESLLDTMEELADEQPEMSVGDFRRMNLMEQSLRITQARKEWQDSNDQMWRGTSSDMYRLMDVAEKSMENGDSVASGIWETFSELMAGQGGWKIWEHPVSKELLGSSAPISGAIGLGSTAAALSAGYGTAAVTKNPLASAAAAMTSGGLTAGALSGGLQNESNYADAMLTVLGKKYQGLDLTDSGQVATALAEMSQEDLAKVNERAEQMTKMVAAFDGLAGGVGGAVAGIGTRLVTRLTKAMTKQALKKGLVGSAAVAGFGADVGLQGVLGASGQVLGTPEEERRTSESIIAGMQEFAGEIVADAPLTVGRGIAYGTKFGLDKGREKKVTKLATSALDLKVAKEEEISKAVYPEAAIDDANAGKKATPTPEPASIAQEVAQEENAEALADTLVEGDARLDPDRPAPSPAGPAEEAVSEDAAEVAEEVTTDRADASNYEAEPDHPLTAVADSINNVFSLAATRYENGTGIRPANTWHVETVPGNSNRLLLVERGSNGLQRAVEVLINGRPQKGGGTDTFFKLEYTDYAAANTDARKIKNDPGAKIPWEDMSMGLSESDSSRHPAPLRAMRKAINSLLGVSASLRVDPFTGMPLEDIDSTYLDIRDGGAAPQIFSGKAAPTKSAEEAAIRAPFRGSGNLALAFRGLNTSQVAQYAQFLHAQADAVRAVGNKKLTNNNNRLRKITSHPVWQSINRNVATRGRDEAFNFQNMTQKERREAMILEAERQKLLRENRIIEREIRRNDKMLEHYAAFKDSGGKIDYLSVARDLQERRAARLMADLGVEEIEKAEAFEDLRLPEGTLIVGAAPDNAPDLFHAVTPSGQVLVVEVADNFVVDPDVTTIARLKSPPTGRAAKPRLERAAVLLGLSEPILPNDPTPKVLSAFHKRIKDAHTKQEVHLSIAKREQRPLYVVRGGAFHEMRAVGPTPDSGRDPVTSDNEFRVSASYVAGIAPEGAESREIAGYDRTEKARLLEAERKARPSQVEGGIPDRGADYWLATRADGSTYNILDAVKRRLNRIYKTSASTASTRPVPSPRVGPPVGYANPEERAAAEERDRLAELDRISTAGRVPSGREDALSAQSPLDRRTFARMVGERVEGPVVEARYNNYLEFLGGIDPASGKKVADSSEINPEIAARVASANGTMEDVLLRSAGLAEAKAAAPRELNPSRDPGVQPRPERVEGPDYEQLKMRENYRRRGEFLAKWLEYEPQSADDVAQLQQATALKLQEEDAAAQELASTKRGLNTGLNEIVDNLVEHYNVVAQYNGMSLDEFMELESVERAARDRAYLADTRGAALVDRRAAEEEMRMMELTDSPPYGGLPLAQMTKSQFKANTLWKIANWTSASGDPANILTSVDQAYEEATRLLISQKGGRGLGDEEVAEKLLRKLQEGVILAAGGRTPGISTRNTDYHQQVRALAQREVNNAVSGVHKTNAAMLTAFEKGLAELNDTLFEGSIDEDVGANLPVRQQADDVAEEDLDSGYYASQARGRPPRLTRMEERPEEPVQEEQPEPEESGRQAQQRGRREASLVEELRQQAERAALVINTIRKDKSLSPSVKEAKIALHEEARQYALAEIKAIEKARKEAKDAAKKAKKAAQAARSEAELPAEVEREITTTAQEVEEDIVSSGEWGPRMEQRFRAILDMRGGQARSMAGSIDEELAPYTTARLEEALTWLDEVAEGPGAEEWKARVVAEIGSRRKAYADIVKRNTRRREALKKTSAAEESGSQTPLTDEELDLLEEMEESEEEQAEDGEDVADDVVNAVLDTSTLTDFREMEQSTDTASQYKVLLDPEEQALEEMEAEASKKKAPPKDRTPLVRPEAARQHRLLSIARASLSKGKSGLGGRVGQAFEDVTSALDRSTAIRSRVKDFLRARFWPAVKAEADRLGVPREDFMRAVGEYATGTLGARLNNREQTRIADTRIVPEIKRMWQTLNHLRAGMIGDNLVTETLRTTIENNEFHIRQSVGITSNARLIAQNMFGAILGDPRPSTAKLSSILEKNPRYVAALASIFGDPKRILVTPPDKLIQAAQAGWYGEALQNLAVGDNVDTKAVVKQIKAMVRTNSLPLPTEASIKKGLGDYVSTVARDLGAYSDDASLPSVQDLQTEAFAKQRSIKTTRTRLTEVLDYLGKRGKARGKDGELTIPGLATAIDQAAEAFEYAPAEMDYAEFKDFLNKVREIFPNKEASVLKRFDAALSRAEASTAITEQEAVLWRAAGQRQDPAFGMADTAYRLDFHRAMSHAVSKLILTLHKHPDGARVTSDKALAERRGWVNLAEFYGDLAGAVWATRDNATKKQSIGTINSLKRLSLRLPPEIFGNNGLIINMVGEAEETGPDPKNESVNVRIYVEPEVALALHQRLDIARAQAGAVLTGTQKLESFFAQMSANLKAGVTTYNPSMYPRNYLSMAISSAMRFGPMGDYVLSGGTGKASLAYLGGLGRGAWTNSAELLRYIREGAAELNVGPFPESPGVTRAIGEASGVAESGWVTGHIASMAIESQSEIAASDPTFGAEVGEGVASLGARAVDRISRAAQLGFKSGDAGPRISGLIGTALNLTQAITGMSYKDAAKALKNYGKQLESIDSIFDEQHVYAADRSEHKEVAQALREATFLIKHTTPTWSATSPLVLKLSRNFVFGPFITFNWEVSRNAINTFRLAGRMMDGKLPSGQPVVGAEARERVRRVGKLMMAQAGLYYGPAISLTASRKAFLVAASSLGGDRGPADDDWELEDQELLFDILGGPNVARYVSSYDVERGTISISDWSRVIPEAILGSQLAEIGHAWSGEVGWTSSLSNTLAAIVGPYTAPEVIVDVARRGAAEGPRSPEETVEDERRGDIATEHVNWMEPLQAAAIAVAKKAAQGRYHHFFDVVTKAVQAVSDGEASPEEYAEVQRIRAALSGTMHESRQLSDDELLEALRGDEDKRQYLEGILNWSTASGVPQSVMGVDELLIAGAFEVRSKTKVAAMTAAIAMFNPTLTGAELVAELEDIYGEVETSVENMRVLGVKLHELGFDVEEAIRKAETRLGVKVYGNGSPSSKSIAGVSLTNVLAAHPDNMPGPTLFVPDPQKFEGGLAISPEQAKWYAEGTDREEMEAAYARNYAAFSSWMHTKSAGSVNWDPIPVNVVPFTDVGQQQFQQTGPEPRRLYGQDAIDQVESEIGMPLPEHYKDVVRHEGYVFGDYFVDGETTPTSGVGQKGEYRNMTALESIEAHEERARSRTDNYDRLPVYVKGAILQAEYRGDWGLSDNTRRLFNQGDYEAAADEFLRNDDYLESKRNGTGVAKRMEEVAEAFRRYARETQ